MAARLTDKQKKKIIADYVQLGSYNAVSKISWAFSSFSGFRSWSIAFPRKSHTSSRWLSMYSRAMISAKQKKILAFPYSGYDALICDGAIRSGKTSIEVVAFIELDSSRPPNTSK
mgnify:CR=1 FL=1